MNGKIKLVINITHKITLLIRSYTLSVRAWCIFHLCEFIFVWSRVRNKCLYILFICGPCSSSVYCIALICWIEGAFFEFEFVKHSEKTVDIFNEINQKQTNIRKLVNQLEFVDEFYVYQNVHNIFTSMKTCNKTIWYSDFHWAGINDGIPRVFHNFLMKT